MNAENAAQGTTEKRKRFDRIDGLLTAAIVVLSSFLLVETGPMAARAWRNRLRSGAQVERQAIMTEPATDSGNEPKGGSKDGPKDGREGRQKKEGAGRQEFAINYLLYLPRAYGEKDKEPWPLLVFLHGAGERGNDLEIVRRTGLPSLLEPAQTAPVDSILLDRFIIASPQCPADTHWQPEQVMALIEHLAKEFPVDHERIYLTGFSMGGFGTWATAIQYPERLAAIAPLAGGGDPPQAERLTRLPIWAFHGGKDETVSLESSQKTVDAVRQCGGRAKLTVYPDAGHGICEETYRNPELFTWLLSHKREQLANAAPQIPEHQRQAEAPLK